MHLRLSTKGGQGGESRVEGHGGRWSIKTEAGIRVTQAEGKVFWHRIWKGPS